jgi:transposase
MLGKSEVELSSISIANDKSEVLQNQIIQLYEKRQAIERNIELLKPLSYVSNFPVYKKPKDRTWFRLGVLSGAFLLIGIVIALFRDVRLVMNR